MANSKAGMEGMREIDFRNAPCSPRLEIGCCRFDKESNQIIIKVPSLSSFEYEVDLDRCETAGAALDWLHQVCTKVWGREVIADFLEILFDYINVDLWSGQ